MFDRSFFRVTVASTDGSVLQLIISPIDFRIFKSLLLKVPFVARARISILLPQVKFIAVQFVEEVMATAGFYARIMFSNVVIYRHELDAHVDCIALDLGVILLKPTDNVGLCKYLPRLECSSCPIGHN